VRICYVITLTLAVLGALYNEFSEPALAALLFISLSALPLIVYGDAVRTALPVAARDASFGLRIARVSALAAAIANCVIFVSSRGFGGADALTLEGIIGIAGQATADRYIYGEASGNPLLVATVFINAYLWAVRSRAVLAASIPALLPAVAYSILSTEKWPLYCAFSFFVTGSFVDAYVRGRGYARVLLWPAAFGIAGGLLSLAARSGLSEAGSDVSLQLSAQLAHYVFAQYQAFGLWLMSHYADCCSLGATAFIGPLSLLGLVDRPPGVFEDFVVVNGMETNIFTAWRYWVQDFSLIGPLVLIGCFAAAYRYFLLNSCYRICLGLLILLTLSTLLQINTTLFVHNSVTLAAVICPILTCSLLFKAHESPRTVHLQPRQG
jgi:oligosaccharide repeat unit polymerase